MFKIWQNARFQALRHPAAGVLTLFFSAADAAFAASADYDAALSGYVARMVLALLLLGGIAFAVTKYLPGRFGMSGKSHLKVICALSVGRDMLYIVQAGPRVVAFLSGKSGATVLERWSLEEWEDYAAALSFAEKVSSEDKSHGERM
jgi:hypothetical protein